jgi:hypothetical protein
MIAAEILGRVAILAGSRTAAKRRRTSIMLAGGLIVFAASTRMNGYAPGAAPFISKLTLSI